MSGSFGLTSELLNLINTDPGIEASELAEKRQQVYQALWQLKDSGRVEKKGKGYFPTSKGRTTAPKSTGLGWGGDESDEPARKPAEVRGDGKGAALPPAPDPDRAPSLMRNPHAEGAWCQADRRKKDALKLQKAEALFTAFLDALLAACKADSNAALRALAEGVEEHKPESLQ